VLVLIGTTTMRGHTKTFDARRFVEAWAPGTSTSEAPTRWPGNMSRFVVIWRGPENHRADE
jgi:hypothetical protein